MEHPTIAEMFEPPEKKPSSGVDNKPVRSELQQVPAGLVHGEKPGREAELSKVICLFYIVNCRNCRTKPT